MTDQPDPQALKQAAETVERDLPMVSSTDPEALAAEKAYLRELEAKPFPLRLWGYFRLSGPGWLQGALTLGGGSAGSSLFAGALMGYALLWVQPVAMFFGVIMLAALAHQTLSTRMRPFQAVNHFAHPFLGWGWALTSLLASIVWSLPQFNLAGSVIGDMMTAGRDISPDSITVTLGQKFSGSDAAPQVAAAAFWSVLSAPVILFVTLYVTWNYSKGRRGIRWFENLLKLMVAGIVICFAIVALTTKTDWSAVGSAYTSFHVPDDAKRLGVLISAFATAVGINMTFLFPYTLLARGWGREHRGLAKFDLSVGMLIPFVIATSFVIISASNVLHPGYKAELARIQADPTLTEADRDGEIEKLDRKVRGAGHMAGTLESFLGRRWGPLVFGLGIIGMTVSSIVMLMLVSGFIMAEMCGGQPNGTAYRIGVLLPALGCLGPILWGALAFWLVVPTSVICFFFLPIAYISFLVMMNRRDYLREDMPAGLRRVGWNGTMGLAILVIGAAAVYMATVQFREWYPKLMEFLRG